MPVTSADLLSAAIAPRLTFAPDGQSAPTVTGTPVPISFENVLASAQASPTTLSIPTTLANPAVELIASAVATPESVAAPTADIGLSTIDDQFLTADLPESLAELSPSDLAGTLAFFFSVANTATTTAEVSAVVPVTVTVVPEVDATTAEIAVVTLETVPSQIENAGETRTRSEEIRLAQSPSISKTPSSVVVRESSSITTTAIDTNAKRAEESPEAPVETVGLSRIDATLAIPNTVANTVTTAATPADTGRAASRTPSVVAQSPIIVNHPPVLPGESPFALDRPVQPPTVPIREVSPISPNEQPPLNQRPGTLLAQESAVANGKTKVGNEFATEFRRVDAAAPAVLPSIPTPEAIVTSNVPAFRPTDLATGETARAEEPIPTPSFATRSSLPDPADGQLADRSRLDADVSIPGSVPTAGNVQPTVRFAAPAAQPTPAAQLANAIIEHSAIAERDGKFEIQIRLDPPELGPVKVKLIAHGDRLSAEVVVSNDAIRSMIESQLPDLRQRLEQAGLNLPNFDVSTGGHGSKNSDTEERDQQSFGARPASPAPRRFPAARSTVGSSTVDVVV